MRGRILRQEGSEMILRGEGMRLTPIEHPPVHLETPPEQRIDPSGSLLALLRSEGVPQVVRAIVRSEEGEVVCGERHDLGSRGEDGRDPAEEEVGDGGARSKGRDGAEVDGLAQGCTLVRLSNDQEGRSLEEDIQDIEGDVNDGLGGLHRTRGRGEDELEDGG